MKKKFVFDSLHLNMGLATNQSEGETAPADGRRRAIFWALLAAISVVVLVYAVTRAFVWDEGYHLIAAQQISQGKLPYIDFCFPQTPLNAFLNGGIVKLFGQHWRPVHVVAALFSLGAIFLTADFMLLHFPAPRWRFACALTAGVFVGLNEVVIEFGTIGQAYGVCLFFSVAAYRVALATPARASVLPPLVCGLLAGIAAGSSLLTAPILPVLLVWIWIYDRVGLPWRKALAFIAGAAVAFLPVFWLFLKAPPQTFFNIAQYHALYRRADWPGATFHDLLVFTSWIDSTQALTLVLLAVAGVVFIKKHSAWERWQRAEFYLALWICVAVGAYLCTPHPTFGRYFIFLTPFVTILAMAGLFALGSRLGYGGRPAWPASIASGLMALMCVKAGINSTEATTWPEYEKVARKVAEVAPPGSKLFADEVVYFALQRNPPEGMEVSYTHVITIPPEEEKLFHIVSEPELKSQIGRHEFGAVQSCSDPMMDRFGLPGPYRYKVDIDDCTIFWGERPK
jgi:hypothetical protein